MSASPSRSDGPGRPRDTSRDEVILSTAFDMLADLGYDDLKVDDIARTARVGLSTMYRRWPTKVDLVVAALGHASNQAGGPSPDNVRDQLARVAATLRAKPAFLPGIVSAMRADPALADAVRQRLRGPDQERTRQTIRDQLPSHIDRETVQLLAELGPAIMFTRALVDNEPPTDELVNRLDALIALIITAAQKNQT